MLASSSKRYGGKSSKDQDEGSSEGEPLFKNKSKANDSNDGDIYVVEGIVRHVG